MITPTTPPNEPTPPPLDASGGEVPRGENYASPVRVWPAGRAPRPEVTVETRCARCEQPWQIHRSMSGYRLRCACGGWVAVPYPMAEVERERRKLAPRASLSQLAARARTREAALLAAPAEKEARTPESDEPPAAPEPLPMVTAERMAPTARDIDRGILATISVAGALLGPPIVAALTFGLERSVDYLPFTALISGALVLLVGGATGQMGVEGLRGAKLSHYLGAIVLAGLGVIAAQFWVELVGGGAIDPLVGIVDRLGVPLALFALALCPAIFEELGFRGIIQGRLISLMGAPSGVVLTAFLFTIAHGVSLASPIHLLLGLVLGGLRLRTGSLYPGMLLHGLYNGSLIILAAA